MNLRRPALLIVSAMLALLLLWLLGPRDGFMRADSERVLTPPGTPDESHVQLTHTQALGSPADSVRELATESEFKKPLDAQQSACVVLGRAVDENDLPLADVRVRLLAYKMWADGVSVPRLQGKAEHYGFEMATGPDGRFRFETPVPTAESTWLTLDPDPFHESARLTLGGKRRDVRAPLQLGDNDLGSIRLGATGAIRGSVRDETGAPVADARLAVRSASGQALGREAFSDAAGNFVVGHAPAGSLSLSADAEGYLTETRTPIDVKLGLFTDNVDFVVRKAPTLSGFVVDDTGAPIEGVMLVSFPTQGRTRSLADGTFTISLRQDVPQSLEATREGYEPFAVGDRSVHYSPGSSDIRIVMRPLDALTMLIVDAKTDQPITTFGHEMLPNASSHTSHSFDIDVLTPPEIEHPDGRLTVSFRPGIDVIDIGAPGYESRRFDPGPGIPPDRMFVVKLAPSASVFGRVLTGGALTGGVTVRLEAGEMEQRSMRDRNPIPPRFKTDLDGTSVRTSAPDGTFRFDRVRSGRYRLIARSRGGDVACVNNFYVTASASCDLGDIDLAPGAVVHGVVLVPPDRSAAGLVVRVDDRNQGEKCVTDADGRFRFDALTSGWHQFILADAPGIRLVPPVDALLVAGEVREIEIDARRFGTCRVDLTILIDDTPASNVQVSLKRHPGLSFDLGATDRDGRLSRSVPLADGVGVTVQTVDGVRMTHPTLRLDLALDGNVVEIVRFNTASVEFVLPATLVLPKRASVRLELTPVSGATSSALSRFADVVQGAAQGTHVSFRADGRRLRFNSVLAGEWQGVFDVSDAADPTENVPIGDHRWELRRKTVYSASIAFTVLRGQTTQVNLP